MTPRSGLALAGPMAGRMMAGLDRTIAVIVRSGGVKPLADLKAALTDSYDIERHVYRFEQVRLGGRVFDFWVSADLTSRCEDRRDYDRAIFAELLGNYRPIPYVEA